MRLSLRRTDRIAIRDTRRTAAGVLIVPASVSRTGLQSYRSHDGAERVEYRPDSEVFAPEAMASLRGAVVTVGHTHERTPKPVGLASDRDPVRAKRGDHEFLETDLLITDQETARKIEAKELTEISLDYTATLDPTGGRLQDGREYHGTQRNIRIHSAALLPPGQARAGREARIRLDGNEELCNEENTDMSEKTIVKIKLDDGRLVEQGGADHIAALEANIRCERERADALQTQLTAAQTQATAEKARADSLAAQPAPDLGALVTAEFLFRDCARPLLEQGYDFTGKSRAQIMRDAVGAEACKRVDAEPEATREVYLRVTFDQAAAAKKSGAPVYRLNEPPAPRADAQGDFLTKLDAGFKRAGGSK